MLKFSKEYKKSKKIFSSPRKSSSEDDKILANLKKFANIKHNSEKLKNKLRLRKGQWCLHEDKLLKEWIRKNGPSNWEKCGIFIKGRNGKQCREHWNECLNPDLIKGEWTAEEDFLIMYFYEKCNGSWKKIIHLLNGRNKNSIKNRFYCQMRKIAGKYMTIDEKKACPKIKLEELKKSLKEAIINSKNKFLNEKQISEEQFKIYLDKMELKLNQKLEEEKEYLKNSLISNLIKFKSTNKFLKKENKESTFRKKRKRTKDKNSIINIKKEKDKIEENNMININENKKNYLNNNVISKKENNEYKFGLEKFFDINRINNENIITSKEEEKNDDDDNENINSKNLNPFDIKFIDFLSPCDEFKETNLNYRNHSYNNFTMFDNNHFKSYSVQSIEDIEERKDLNFYDGKIDIFED